MTIWAISDLHLSHARPATRSQYAARWQDHTTQIADHWRSVVARADLVLIPGDFSMARNHREVQPDLSWLGRLPGTKVLSPGNHDQWYNTAAAIRPMMRPGMHTVCGDAISVNGLVIAGARGTPATPPDDRPESLAASTRALAELEQSLAQAATLRAPGQPLCVLWHFPPFDRFGAPGPVVPLLEAAEVTACLYGHLHALDQWSRAAQGVIRGVRFHCVAADAIGFRPLKIPIPLPD